MMTLSLYQTYAIEGLYSQFPATLVPGVDFIRRRDLNNLLVLGSWSPMPYLTGSYFPAPTRYVLAPPEQSSTVILDNRKTAFAALRQYPVNLVVFPRSGSPKDGVFVGLARLGALVCRSSNAIEIAFSLEQKLPRELWLGVGGFAGWQLMVDEERYYSVVQEEDLSLAVSKELDRHSVRIAGERYEGDRLLLLLDGEAGFVTWEKSPVGPEYVSQSPIADAALSSEPMVFFPDADFPTEIRRAWVVPRERAINYFTSLLFDGVPSEMVRFK
jgi:hypothetical protein